MIFVTGGAGYIGSHTRVELWMAGRTVAVGHRAGLKAVSELDAEPLMYYDNRRPSGAGLSGALPGRCIVGGDPNGYKGEK